MHHEPIYRPRLVVPNQAELDALLSEAWPLDDQHTLSTYLDPESDDLPDVPFTNDDLPPEALAISQDRALQALYRSYASEALPPRLRKLRLESEVNCNIDEIQEAA